MKKFEPNPDGGLPREAPIARMSDQLTTNVPDASDMALTMDHIQTVMGDVDKMCLDRDKRLIEALIASGFRVLVGGGRTDLPVAILPASFAKAWEAVINEANNRDPVENSYRNAFGIFSPGFDRAGFQS